MPWSSFRATVAVYLLAGVSSLTLLVVMRDELTAGYHTDEFEWEKLLLWSILALAAEVGVALLWHQLRHHCSRVKNSVGSRLWRGAVIPLLVAVPAMTPAAGLYLIQSKTETLNMPIEHFWNVLSFGVVFAALPVAVAITQTYAATSEEDQLPVTSAGWRLTMGSSKMVRVRAEEAGAGTWRGLLATHEIYRADLFMWGHRGYASLSGLLPFCFWIPYMANELQIFLHSLAHASSSTTASVTFTTCRL